MKHGIDRTFDLAPAKVRITHPDGTTSDHGKARVWASAGHLRMWSEVKRKQPEEILTGELSDSTGGARGPWTLTLADGTSLQCSRAGGCGCQAAALRKIDPRKP